MIDESYIQKVVHNTDIEALAQRYTRLFRREDGSFAGRCPVHNGAPYSFIVEPDREVCSCSVCGRAWGVIDLVREVEHTDFDGAVRLLASRAGIPLPDDSDSHNLTDSEAMFAANEHAAGLFSSILTDTDEGRNIGLSYFRSRGISDDMIRVFGLGFSPEARNKVHEALIEHGIDPQVLVNTGLSVLTERGDYYDRYHSRVIYPVHTVSGRVVAFGARTLRSDKDISKYLNSPESLIYNKSSELYGLYQARDAIVEKGYAILVEGYMDVISMHQAGVLNVVASSGTSLTVGQVQLLRRFTDRVLVIYDSDAAGIKASVRSIDMLLSAGMDMRSVTLPAGEDPDSFARSHSPEETEQYLQQHSMNMVDYRLSLLSAEVMRDPVQRTRAVSEIIDSIALVNDDNRRRELIAVCRNRRELRLNECSIVTQVSRRIIDNAARNAEVRRRNEASRAFDEMEADMIGISGNEAARRAYLRPYEQSVIRFAVRYGIMHIPDASAYSPDGGLAPMSVVEMIDTELKADEMEITNPDLKSALDYAVGIYTDHEATAKAYADYDAQANALRDRLMEEGIDKLRHSITDLSNLEALEQKLSEDVNAEADAYYSRLCAGHVASLMMTNREEPLRRIAAESLRTIHRISTIYTRSAVIADETENLADKIMLQIYCLKYATVLWQIKETHDAIRLAGDDFETIRVHMIESKRLSDIKKLLARNVGDRVIAPPF